MQTLFLVAGALVCARRMANCETNGVFLFSAAIFPPDLRARVLTATSSFFAFDMTRKEGAM
jgi:hypothetical protein